MDSVTVNRLYDDETNRYAELTLVIDGQEYNQKIIGPQDNNEMDQLIANYAAKYKADLSAPPVPEVTEVSSPIVGTEQGIA